MQRGVSGIKRCSKVFPMQWDVSGIKKCNRVFPLFLAEYVQNMHL